MSVMPVLFKKFLLEALSIAVSAGVALSPPPAGLETEAMWVAGLLVWTLLNLITGKAGEKKISPLMYVLTVLFILKYVLL